VPPAKRSRPGPALVVVFVVLVGLFGGMALAGTWSPALGLDLRGGTTVTLKAQPLAGHKVTQENLNTAVSIMRERVNGKGVGNADVKTEGTNIVVSVPGKDKQGVLDQIGQTALLSIRQVYKSNDPSMSGAVVPDTGPTSSATPAPTPGSTPAPSGSASPQASGAPASPSPAAASPASSAGAASPAAAASPSAAPTVDQKAPAQTTPTQAQLDAYNQLDCTKPENQ